MPEPVSPRPMLGLVSSVAELLDAPARALELAPAEAVAMLAEVEGLAAVLRIAAAAEPRDRTTAGDALLSVAEAAARAGVNHDSFLRRRAFRPAIVKQGHRTLRVNAKRLERILAQMES